MNQLKLILAVLILGIAGLSVSPDAEALYTSTLWTHGLSDGAGAACTVTNISSSDLAVNVQLVAAAGNVVDSKDLVLAPGKTDLTVGSVASNNYYCKFVVSKANKIRANLQILAEANGVVFLRAISEAR